MPRDGSGVYSKPAGTTAVANTVIESAKYNSQVDDMVADANAARPITAGGTGGTSVATAQVALSLDNKTVYATKSGNYTALANDNNAIHYYTATATVSLTAAATLGANWHYTVVANGAAVTIDPNASETINGSTTLIVPNGTTATIICDGSNFFTVLKPNPWELISILDQTSAVTSVAFTNLSAFRQLRLRFVAVNSPTAATFSFSVSEDNGSTWVAGGTDYVAQFLYGFNTTVATATSTGATINLSNGSTVDLTYGAFGSIEFNAFNVSQPTRLTIKNGFRTGGFWASMNIDGVVNRSVATNAFRITSTQNFTGNFILEGVRG